MSVKKFYIKGTLECVSPIAVGSGESDYTDRDVLCDCFGKPYIPGTTLAGVCRHYLEQCGYDTESLFGCIGEKTLIEDEEFIYNKSESRIIFYEGFSESNFVKSFRDGVRIKDGVADDGSKYDYEIIESGCEFSFRIEIDSFNDSDRKMLCSMINGFNNGFIRIGHKTNRGLGKVKIKVLKYKSVKSIGDLIEFNWEKVQDDFICYNTEDSLHNAFSQRFTVRSFVMIANNATFKKKEDKLINAEQLKNAKEKAVIPGSSWAGVFRHHFIKILTQVSYNNIDAFMDKLFGCTEQTALILFDESVIEKPVFMMQTRNAIDRFTAGASEKKLFTNELSFGGEVQLNIYLKKSAIGARILTDVEFELAKNLIELTIKDIDDGFVNIGGLGSVGGGLLKSVKVGDL